MKKLLSILSLLLFSNLAFAEISTEGNTTPSAISSNTCLTDLQLLISSGTAGSAQQCSVDATHAGSLELRKDYSAGAFVFGITDNTVRRLGFFNAPGAGNNIGMIELGDHAAPSAYIDIDTGMIQIRSNGTFDVIFNLATSRFFKMTSGYVIIEQPSVLHGDAVGGAGEAVSVSSNTIAPTTGYARVTCSAGTLKTISASPSNIPGSELYLDFVDGCTLDETGNLLIDSTSGTVTADDVVHVRYNGTKWKVITPLVVH